MKLRTRLLLALLAVSVVPVGLVTFLSYRSSLAAFRETVEAEGRATAAEMARRMGAVEADLSRRVEGLGRRGGVPLLASGEGAPVAAAPGPAGEQLLAELERELGAATALLERVEIAAPEPVPGAEGAVPPAAPVVIDLGEVMKHAGGFVPDVIVDGTNVTYGALERLPPEVRRAIDEQRRAEAAAAVAGVPPVPPVPPPAPVAPSGRELKFRIRSSATPGARRGRSRSRSAPTAGSTRRIRARSRCCARCASPSGCSPARRSTCWPTAKPG